ncbi:MAG: hypothetical protein CM1200mP18_19660 [Gammaproteobacteria bacterium]|nr:MAG: hypothetical protein CM1200mP18_19660 [Gammaproteobacteria bacterium]
MNTDTFAGQNKSSWNYQPSLPIEGVPVFVWPPRPVAAIKYLLSRAFSVFGCPPLYFFCADHLVLLPTCDYALCHI